MSKQQRGGVIHFRDRDRDAWPQSDFRDVYVKPNIKLPEAPKNHMILTCNPSGLNIFHKNFINDNNERDSR
jgi:hypothetical protein